MKTLSSEDAFFLYIETPDQHQHVVSTLVLDTSGLEGGLDIPTLMQSYGDALRAAPEFSQKLVRTPMALAPPVLAEDPGFDPSNHMHHIAVPAPGTLRQLAAIVEDIASTPLSHRRPLWESWFISGLEGERTAVVFKSHHLLFDGVHGARFMSQLFASDPGQPLPSPSKGGENRPRRRSRWELTTGALMTQWRYQPHYIGVAARTLRSVWHRHGLFGRSRALAGRVPAFFESAPRLRFNAPITPNRTAGMGSTSLVDVLRIKRRLGVTVNDVVVAACTLALRDYLLATDDMPERPLVCYQPVSLALKGQHSHKADQGNEVGTMALKLPVQIADPAELLREVCLNTAAAKEVFDRSFENLLQNYIGVVPPAVAEWSLKHYLRPEVIRYAPCTANVVISNFPGPSQPLYLGGAPLEASYVMGPIISGQGPNITFISYVDRLQFSVQACREHVPDIWLLVDGIARGFEQLAALAQEQAAAAPGPAAEHLGA